MYSTFDIAKVTIQDYPTTIPCEHGTGTQLLLQWCQSTGSAAGCARRHSLSHCVAVNLAWSAHPGPEALSEAPPAAYNSWAGVSPLLQSGLWLRQTCFASSVLSSPRSASPLLANPAVSVLLDKLVNLVSCGLQFLLSMCSNLIL